MVGDTADNIRGTEKIGPKTAAELLHQFGSLEEVLCHAEDVKKSSIRESLQKNAERLRRNYGLILLTGCEQLPFDLHEMVYYPDPRTTTQILQAINLR